MVERNLLLTLLKCSAWVLLNEIYQPFFTSLYFILMVDDVIP